MKAKFILVLILISVFSHTAFAETKSGRTSRRIGLYLSGNGDPAVSIVGANLGFNVTNFLRLHAGVGGASSSLPSNAGAGLYNYTLGPVSYFLSLLIHEIFVSPFSKTLKAPKFTDFKKDYSASQSVFSYGAGANLFVPGWNFSPTLGAHVSRYTSNGHPYGLKDTGGNLYYSAGFDYQADSGFNLGFGYNYCPLLANNSCGAYLNLGGYF